MKKEKIVNKLKNIKNKLSEYFKFLDKKKNFNLMEVIVLMIIVGIFGMFAGGILMYGKGALNTGIKKELNEFVDTYTEILNEYYKEVEEDGLLEAGINGMVDYLGDPYSVFMDYETSVAFNEKVSGEYIGIGVQITMYQDGKIEVSEAYTDGPAYEAGIRDKDVLIKVEDTLVKDMTLDEVSSLVKGEKGTVVKLTVSREEKELEFEVERKNIDIESVSKELIEYENQKIGYLTIDIFAANTYEQFETKLKELENENIDSLIIDIRGNSGGYLSTVTNIISLFLEKGDLIYQLKTKDKVEKIYDKTKEKRDYEIAILVNSGSASASEVLTAALMENHDAYVVGTTTYGKSKVQKTHELSNGTSIKYTFQEWLTPSGDSVGEKGITPEYKVVYNKNLEDEYDSQLKKALDLLSKKEPIENKEGEITNNE